MLLAQTSAGPGHINSIDLGILVAYVLGIMGVALYVSRKAKTTESFTVGSRSMPSWAIGLSILGTYVSSISFLALPGKAYATNWSYYAFSLTLPLSALIAVIWFLPIYRRAGLVSAYEFLEERLGYGGRAYAAACFILLQVVRSGVILFLVAIALEPMAAWKDWQLVIATGLFVTFYCMIGGFEAVIWTDVVQTIVLVGGAVLCVVLLVFFESSDGPAGMFSFAAENHKFSFTPTDLSLEPQDAGFSALGKPIMMSTLWVVLIYGMFENIKNFGIDQNYIQRFVAARSTREAGRSLWLGSLTYVPLSALFFLIGTALFVFYNQSGLTATATQPVATQAAITDAGATLASDQLPEELEDADRVFPYFIQNRLPTGLSGILVAAIFAAAMSTVSTSLNSASTVYMQDFYRRKIRPDASDSDSLRVVRRLTLIFGAAATLAGLLVTILKAQAAIDIWWDIAGVLGGPFLGLFLIAVLIRRLRGIPILIAALCGAAVISWVILSAKGYWPDSPTWLASAQCSWDSKMAGPAGTVAMVAVALVLAGFRATAPRPEPSESTPTILPPTPPEPTAFPNTRETIRNFGEHPYEEPNA